DVDLLHGRAVELGDEEVVRTVAGAAEGDTLDVLQIEGDAAHVARHHRMAVKVEDADVRAGVGGGELKRVVTPAAVDRLVAVVGVPRVRAVVLPGVSQVEGAAA